MRSRFAALTSGVLSMSLSLILVAPNSAAFAHPASGDPTPKAVVAISDKAEATSPEVVVQAVPKACGRVCDGMDPATFQVPNSGGWLCANDAKTIHRKDFPDGDWVELRYSPSCRTAWARGYNPPFGTIWTKIAGFSYNANGSERLRVYAGGGSTSGQFYTAMLDDANLTFKACKDMQFGGEAIWSCTPGY